MMLKENARRPRDASNGGSFISNNVLLLYCGFLLLISGSLNVVMFLMTFTPTAMPLKGSQYYTSMLLLDKDTVGTAPSSTIVRYQEKYKETNRPMKRSRMEELKGPLGPKYNVLVTGAAGFIGMHTAIGLKGIGMTPIGYDNVNEYYSVQLKEKRIEELEKRGIKFVRGDVCNVDKLRRTIREHGITRFIHLAAQAGVRYSFDHPLEYTRNNVDCTVSILEVIAEFNLNDHSFIYASSSSVYGNNGKTPFREVDRVEDPASLYAATKRSDELIAHTYFNLHNISSIGLRFFTVYGPYGR